MLTPVVAPASARTPQDMVAVSILPGWRMADGTLMAALRFELAPGWKTYWRAPGEAGIPPRFDWRGSRNVGAVEVLWPTPQQTTTNGLRTIGYSHDLILPIRITPARTGEPVSLAGDLEIGVCSDICVPVETEVSLDLPLGGDGDRDPRIAAALAARPYTATEAGSGPGEVDVVVERRDTRWGDETVGWRQVGRATRLSSLGGFGFGLEILEEFSFHAGLGHYVGQAVFQPVFI